MQTATGNKIVDSYFKLMRNWDNETKKNLIVKLTQSIDTKDKKRRDFSSCFGAWEDSRTADQIIEDLKADRVDNPEIESF
jgi:hypothetical protein